MYRWFFKKNVLLLEKYVILVLVSIQDSGGPLLGAKYWGVIKLTYWSHGSILRAMVAPGTNTFVCPRDTELAY